MSEPARGPISLSDQGMAMILDACRPLMPQDRQAFMAAIGNFFIGRSEIGDGELGRAIRQLQREFRTPPDLAESPRAHIGKYA